MGGGFSKALTQKPDEISISPSDSPPQLTYQQPRKTPPIAPPKPTQYSSQTGSSSSVLGKPYVKIEHMYDMKKELGRGQFGVTYLCVDKVTGREYACKSIAKKKVQQVEHLIKEVTILQHISGQHNIVEFKGAYEDKMNVHLVMELCSGGELYDRILAKQRYSELEAAIIMRQILSVVHLCHFMGVMHRDIKPENFLFATKDEDAPLKLADFGSSVFIEKGYFPHIYALLIYSATSISHFSYFNELLYKILIV